MEEVMDIGGKAGEQPVKKEKGKHVMGWALAFFMLTFFSIWWINELTDCMLFFLWVPLLAWLVILIVTIVKVARACADNKPAQGFFAMALIIATFVVAVRFPFEQTKRDFDFRFKTPMRQEVVDKIVSGEINSDDKLVYLHGIYKFCSSDFTTVYVYQNDSEGVEVAFWIFRGMLSGSDMMVYSNGGEDLIWKNGDGHPVTSVEHVDGNWYFVKTNY